MIKQVRQAYHDMFCVTKYTDVQTDGQTNQQTDGQTDGWTDHLTGGILYRCKDVPNNVLPHFD